MKKKSLFLDLDNVICDSDTVVRGLIRKYLNIYARKQDIVNFNYWEALGYDKGLEEPIWTEFHEKSCFLTDPVKGLVDALRRLSLFTNIHILTARANSSKLLTIRWLRKHSIIYHSLEFLNESEKVKRLSSVDGALLVEDRGETAIEIARAGNKVIIFDYPWNRKFKHKNLIRLKTWSSIYSYISNCDEYAGALLEIHKKLFEKARSALVNSYSPYSHYKVGAALMTTDGRMFTGCNIENVAYSPTVCAERTAIFKAISEGYRKGDLFAISITACNSTGVVYNATPCGVCRQVMQEFSESSFPLQISIKEKKGGLKLRYLNTLLPLSFNKL